MVKQPIIKPVHLAVIAALSSQSLYAAENTERENLEENKSDEKIEKIEVKGYRGSILKAISQKRNSDTIVDSIFAEDIGKSTDQNIADALSRVTGVTVQESDGEGTRISVRGAGANLNQVSINGVALTSGLNGDGANPVADQAVDLSTFSSDMLASIDVVKTPSADHDEGSLGANVILRTVKPLNVQKDRRSLSIQGRYHEYAGEYDRKISGTITEKFFDDRFGIALTVADETQESRTDRISGDWLTPYQVVPIQAGTAVDSKTGEVISEDTSAIIRKTLNYGLNQNSRDRLTVSGGFQFLPTSTTDVQLDLNYSKTESHTDNHSINVRVPDLWSNKQKFNHTESEDGQADSPNYWVVNQDSHTITKSLNRFGNGGFTRSVGGSINENSVASLAIKQYIGDTLTLDVKAGYSKTDFESLPNSNVGTATWNSLPQEALDKIPTEQLEPVGYDCTSGKCQMVVSTGAFTYVPGGVNNNQSNEATGGFNPLDPYMSHVGYMAKYDNNTTDINKSLFVDLDWDLDGDHFNKAEFGVKYSQRDKDVRTVYSFIDNTETVVFDPETGQPIRGQKPADIAVVNILSGENFPYDNFMDGLVANDPQYSNEFMNGWLMLDSDKAFEQAFAIDDVELATDDSGSRRIQVDTTSLYAKLNFEFLDSKLRGNIGLRYVEDDVHSVGNPTIEYFGGPEMMDGSELIYIKQLANEQLSACPELNASNQGEFLTSEDYPCYDYTLTHNFTNWNQTTNQILEVNYDENGMVTDIVQNDPTANGSWRSWWSNYRHGDTSTQDQFAEEIYGEEVAALNPNAMSRRVYSDTGENNYSILLPSLNLNYLFSNELIGRFAVSKTMSRPIMDHIAPGFKAQEMIWNDFDRVEVFNPKLAPLESNNLDLSIEWYFDKTGMLSLGYFMKDMKNLEEQVTDTFYWNDFRTDYERETLDIADVLIAKDESMMAYDQVSESYNCMPHRMAFDQMKAGIRLGCKDIQAKVWRNASGATTQGIEFNYRQTYDFLPGALAGLGAELNYTYAESESDAEVLQIQGSELTGRELKSLPQPYTPKHSANMTVFWGYQDLELRLANRYNGIQLVNRGLDNGASWQDAKNRLDFTANYKVSQDISVSLHALNLTDDTTRTFFTSTSMKLHDGTILDEGNALDNDVDTSRTLTEYKTGRMYRASVRVNF
ncbi:TonB-dependent receptor [Gayadomonas joobiniege]|uniref:TonB-dependent receptor n=1 Tax=Gayadomonas joobiniege TaxID=1234606 RepID=UPI000364EF9A|nr:TonB-dependent receptor [Gayadomonas joobiniege]